MVCCSAKALKEIDIPIAESIAVNTVDEALDAAEKIGYPIIVRSAYALGGLGSGFANNPEELRNLSARSLSLSPQILVEKSLKGWKEAEYEVRLLIEREIVFALITLSHSISMCKELVKDYGKYMAHVFHIVMVYLTTDHYALI